MSKSISKNGPKYAAILKAATDEFLSNGYLGTSMDRIADAAKVSKRTVYNHFPSKGDLFEAILVEIDERIGNTPNHEYSLEEPLDKQLKSIGKAYAKTISDRQFIKFARVVISQAIHDPVLSRATIKEQLRLRKNIVSWIKSGATDGRLRVKNPERAAALFCGPIKELAFWPQLVTGNPPVSPSQRDALVASSVEMFLDHYQIGEKEY